MKGWLKRLTAFFGPRPELTDQEAAEEAIRVFPRCC